MRSSNGSPTKTTLIANNPAATPSGELNAAASRCILPIKFPYSSTGAAYPQTATYYETFDLYTGRKMTLSDFVDPARHEALRKLVEADFRKQRGADVEFEKLPLDDHFAPLNEGLVFHYSPGDVGPHARGETTVVIPWAAVKGL